MSTRKRSARRGLLIIAAVAATSAVPVGIAIAQSDDFGTPGEGGSEPGAQSGIITLGPTEVIVRGFEDPETGEPITCPDGSLLQQEIKGIDFEGGGAESTSRDPVCPDGSTPAAFAAVKAGWKQLEDQLQGKDPGDTTPIDDGSFIIEDDPQRQP